MEKQNIIFSANVAKDLEGLLTLTDYDKFFILTDDNTRRLCMPLLDACKPIKDAHIITIKNGDTEKNITSLAQIWQELGENGGSRRSLMVNLGGGMVTDLGGFAASTFKRGIPFINIPTTLLAMVDASVGGKTGINFNGLKNEVGVFCNATNVVIDTHFLTSLNQENILSGYAEMLKHGLISNSADWAELINFNILSPDLRELSLLLEKNIQVKQRIVIEDPLELGIRKALNVGHTAGHALESLAMETNHPILHGYAVAWGIICELYLSATKMNFPKQKMRQTVNFIREHYGTMPIDCKQYDRIVQLMKHDKKNTHGLINFTLLSDIGNIHINQSANSEEIMEMLDFYREQF